MVKTRVKPKGGIPSGTGPFGIRFPRGKRKPSVLRVKQTTALKVKPPVSASVAKKIKEAYLTAIIKKLTNTIPEGKLYIFYEYLRFVPASIYGRRWANKFGELAPKSNPDPKMVESDVQYLYGSFRQVRNLSSPGLNKPIDLKFNNKTLARYFFLMWLDTIHDKTYSGTFKNFLTEVSQLPEELQKIVLENIKNDEIAGISNKIGDDYKTESGKFEATLKNKQTLSRWFNTGMPKKMATNSILKNGGISVLLDMEVNQDISTFVNINHENISSKITVANLMDPGVYMLTGIGVKNDMKAMMTDLPKKDRGDMPDDFFRGEYTLNNDYIPNNFRFNFIHPETEETFMSVYSEFNKNIRNPVDRGILLKLTVGGKTIPITPTKKVVGGTIGDILNKIYGDTFQGLVVAAVNKFRTIGNKPNEWFLATGDGNFTAIYANICNILGVNTKLIVDLGTKDGFIDIYGLPSGINFGQAPRRAMSNSRNGGVANRGGNARNQEINNKLNNLSGGRGKTNVEKVNTLKQMLKQNPELMRGFLALKSPNNSQNQNNIGRRERFITALNQEKWRELQIILREAGRINNAKMRVNVPGTASGAGRVGRELPSNTTNEEMETAESSPLKPLRARIKGALKGVLPRKPLGISMKGIFKRELPQKNRITYKNFTNMGLRLRRTNADQIGMAMAAVRIINQNPEIKKRFKILKEEGSQQQKNKFLKAITTVKNSSEINEKIRKLLKLP